MSNPNDRPSNALIPPPPNSAEVSAAFKILAHADITEVPKMPEQMFIEHILPMLSLPAGTAVDLTKWLDVAGTPLRPLDIVDNTTGEVLFRVPALMRSLPTAFQQEINYSEIISETQARENVHSVMAEKFLHQHLSNARTGATLLDVKTASEWNVIRLRYNLPPLTVMGTDGKLINPAVHAQPSGELRLSDDQDNFF